MERPDQRDQWHPRQARRARRCAHWPRPGARGDRRHLPAVAVLPAPL